MRTWTHLLVVAVAGCSSSAGSGGASVTEQCHETIATLCARNGDCSVETGETAATGKAGYVANCTAGASTTLDCSRQTKVTGHPDACAMDIVAMPCGLYVSPTGLPIPASCRSLYAP